MNATWNLYYFLNEENDKEFVIISEGSLSEVKEEFEEDGFKLKNVKNIAGDCTEFPCDRILSFEF